MEHDEFDEEDAEEKIEEALNSIDPTGELANTHKRAEKIATIMEEAEAFAAGQYHGGRSGQEIMLFANRLYMVGYLIHTNNVIKALKHNPRDLDPCNDDIWSYH